MCFFVNVIVTPESRLHYKPNLIKNMENHNHFRVALVGDFNPEVIAHQAIPRALEIAASELSVVVEGVWTATESCENDPDKRLSEFDGVWCVPASPYRSMAGALSAIRFARENLVPFLGTCGGYQHALLEYAQNVLGYRQAGHTEVDAEAEMPLIAPLQCALVEKSSSINFLPDSRIAQIYGGTNAAEMYHCSYGLNAKYLPVFAKSDLQITGFDAAGEAKVVELRQHPFFVGTAFQPERSALRNECHPLISASVQAMMRRHLEKPPDSVPGQSQRGTARAITKRN